MSAQETTDLLENDSIKNTDNSEERNKKSIFSWMISTTIHLFILALLAFLVIPNKEKKKDVIVDTELIPHEPEDKPEEKKVDLVKNLVVIPEEVKIEEPKITEEEIITDKIETPNEVELADLSESIVDAISDKPLTSIFTSAHIGANSAPAGSIGHLRGVGKKKALRDGGGSQQTESVVKWSLWWLANHQEPDGHWDTGKWEGEGSPEADVASTGAALLTFLSAGHSDRNGEFKDTVRTAVEWLIKAQMPNGSFNRRNYANGICTMALAEAFAMGCGGSELKKHVTLAVDYLLQEQNSSGGFFYEGPIDENAPSAKDDMSVTGWCIMGLKSAAIAGIKEKEIKKAFEKCGDLLDVAWHTSDNSSTTKGEAWYRATEHLGSGVSGGACQAIAILTRQYLGWKNSEPWMNAAVQGQISKLPANYESMDVYRAYYSYLALFQVGGKSWQTWNESVSPIIVQAQRQDGDFRGSFDPNDKSHMAKGGRVLFTAFLCLCLETYYRYKYFSDNS